MRAALLLLAADADATDLAAAAAAAAADVLWGTVFKNKALRSAGGVYNKICEVR